MENSIHIKNMVCPRCVMAVEQVLNELDIPFSSVELGEACLPEKLNASQKKGVAKNLKDIGFELLEDKNAAQISSIKALIIQQIHYSKEPLIVNFSNYVSTQLNQNYNSLSRLFSQLEGITIEKFITLQRIKRVKEFLCYDELTLSEIAYQMNYSSVSYLSAQFKKETGMTPTAFKKTNCPKNLDNI